MSTAPDSTTIAEVYVRAFMDDPVAIWIAPDEAHRERTLRAYFRMAVRYANRFGGRLEPSDESLRGAATWLAPGRSPASLLGTLRTGLPALLWTLGPSSIGRFMQFGNTLERLHKEDVKQLHWYLWVLGVDPPHQGQGIGGQTIQPVLREADLSGLPCYLETSKERNVPFYERHGFNVLKEDTLGKDGPRYWTMLRPPVG